MFHDDIVSSCEALEQAGDQTWFAMLLVNDPNAELVGTLRPPPRDPALDEAFEGRDAGVGVERAPRWRSRAPLWVASGLMVAALGVAAVAAQGLLSSAALASASTEQASPRVGSTALVAPNPLAGAVPAGASPRALHDVLDMKLAATTTTGAVERGAAQGKAAPTATRKTASARKAASTRRSSRNWLATGPLASR